MIGTQALCAKNGGDTVGTCEVNLAETEDPPPEGRNGLQRPEPDRLRRFLDSRPDRGAVRAVRTAPTRFAGRRTRRRCGRSLPAWGGEQPAGVAGSPGRAQWQVGLPHLRCVSTSDPGRKSPTAASSPSRASPGVRVRRCSRCWACPDFLSASLKTHDFDNSSPLVHCSLRASFTPNLSWSPPARPPLEAKGAPSSKRRRLTCLEYGSWGAWLGAGRADDKTEYPQASHSNPYV